MDIEPGDYYLGMEADILGAVTDRNRTNNRKTSMLPIIITGTSTGANLPDLAVTIQSISSTEWTSGTMISWKAKVKNLGDVASGTNTLRLKIKFQGSSNEVILKNELLPTTPANSEQIIDFPAFQVPGSLTSGDYSLLAVIDAIGEVTEISETNNNASFGTIHYAGNGDIKISGYVMNAKGQAESGVKLTGLPGNPITNFLGYYSVFVPSGWSGVATPEKSGNLIFDVNDVLHTALTKTTYQNVTNAIQSDYVAVNVYDMVEKVATNERLADFLITDMTAKANAEALLDAYKFVSYAVDVYGILSKDEDDVTKYFDLIDLAVNITGTIVGAPASASFGIGVYMYIAKQTLIYINETIAEYYRQLNFSFFPETLQFFLKIEKDNFFSTDVSPTVYTPYLKAYLNMYDGTVGQGNLQFIERREMSVEISSNDKVKLQALSPFNEDGYGRVYTIELIWNQQSNYLKHSFIVPAKEPFIEEVFVSATDYNINFEVENGHDLTNSALFGGLLGVEYLKIKH